MESADQSEVANHYVDGFDIVSPDKTYLKI